MTLLPIFRTKKLDKANKELEVYRIEKVRYENILTLIDIECRKQALSEDSSYELKMFSNTIRDIIVNNYIANINNWKDR